MRAGLVACVLAAAPRQALSCVLRFTPNAQRRSGDARQTPGGARAPGGAFASVAASCGGDDDTNAGDDAGASEAQGVRLLPEVTALPSASCADIEYEGEGEPDVPIAFDLPPQGTSWTQTPQIRDAIRHALDSVGWKAGAVNVGYERATTAVAGSSGTRASAARTRTPTPRTRASWQ